MNWGFLIKYALKSDVKPVSVYNITVTINNSEKVKFQFKRKSFDRKLLTILTVHNQLSETEPVRNFCSIRYSWDSVEVLYTLTYKQSL
jgi:hypothetical protein